MYYQLLKNTKYFNYFRSKCNQNDVILKDFIDDVKKIHIKLNNDGINDLAFFEKMNELKKHFTLLMEKVS